VAQTGQVEEAAKIARRPTEPDRATVAASGQLEPGDGVDRAGVRVGDPPDVTRHDLDATAHDRPDLGAQTGDGGRAERPVDHQDD
jgi:hypothetical protein